MKSVSKISTLLLLSAFLFINCEKDKVLDCNGVEDGTAYLDECDECVEGTTGKEPCLNDTRDGKKYKTVKIGTQVWMAENLAYLPSVHSNSEFATRGNNSQAGYGVHGYDGNNVTTAKSQANFTTYGVLYNWWAALTACPTGWRLPGDAEWTVLTTYLGGTSVAGGKMKSTTGWNAPNTAATNSSGFSGLPGGYRSSGGPFFDQIGDYGYWWSSTETAPNDAWARDLYYDRGDVGRFGNDEADGLSCRCLMD